MPTGRMIHSDLDGIAVAFPSSETRAWLVHLEVTATRLRDPETGVFSFKVDSWALITWSNRRMTDSYKDWHRDCTVHASDITLDNPAVTQALESSGLLICTTMGLQESICPCGTC